MFASDVRKEALGGVERLGTATSTSDVLRILGSALQPFGAEFFCINFLPAPGQKFEDVLLTQRVPADWLQLYFENGFCSTDPSLRHCRYTTHPFEYLESPYNRETEPEFAEVVDRADDFGLTKGFLVPIVGTTGCEGNVWIGGHDLMLADNDKPVAHLLALYAFESVRHLSGRCETKKPKITSREREVLSWIAAGKSAWEIGEILDISKRTVEEHFIKAARKLNASNRAQAVAHAIRYRLIEP